MCCNPWSLKESDTNSTCGGQSPGSTEPWGRHSTHTCAQAKRMADSAPEKDRATVSLF